MVSRKVFVLPTRTSHSIRPGLNRLFGMDLLNGSEIIHIFDTHWVDFSNNELFNIALARVREIVSGCGNCEFYLVLAGSSYLALLVYEAMKRVLGRSFGILVWDGNRHRYLLKRPPEVVLNAYLP